MKRGHIRKLNQADLDQRIKKYAGKQDISLNEEEWKELIRLAHDTNLFGAQSNPEYYAKTLLLTQPRMAALGNDFPKTDTLELLRIHAVAAIHVGATSLGSETSKQLPDDYLNDSLVWSRALRRISLPNLARRLLEKRVFSLLFGSNEWSTENLVLFDELRSELALCTTISTDLPSAKRLQQALDILATELGGSKRELTPNNKHLSGITLHIAGTILKKRWELMLARTDLESAACFYEAAYRWALEKRPLDHALYSAAEATMQFDRLASLLLESHHERFAKSYFDHAHAIRKEIASQLEYPYLNFNFRALIDVALIHLGLEDLTKADEAIDLALYRSARTESWRRRGGATELLEFGRIRPVLKEDANQLAARLLGDHVDASASLESLAYPKVGLALSGGGFRASFYHLGVLAALAELGLLRHVEVLSCVSGGSIIGTLYYRELADLLISDGTPTKSADSKNDEAYLKLVQSVIDKFQKATESNFRQRVMHPDLLRQGSTTSRLSKLFDEALYARQGKTTVLQDLKLVRDNETLNPVRDNWKRDRKIPQLIINATSLNTGHNWQFAATFMGESPVTIDPTIDAMDRLRRMYLDEEAPGEYSSFPLGAAVSASACVPGLFEPVELDGLYPSRSGERYTVRLVDGGVHDNQGVASLVDQDCRVLLVSDASGQLGSESSPSRWRAGCTARSNSILMERIRQLQYRELTARKQAKLLDAMVFVHLKQGVEGVPIDWEGCDDPKAPEVGVDKPSCEPGGVCHCEKTAYGILVDLQSKLAELRTDLDAFTEIEADALIYSGYAAMHHYVNESLKDPSASTARFRQLLSDSPLTHDWSFSWVRKYLTHCSEPGSDRVTRILSLGRYQFLRPLRLGRLLLQKNSHRKRNNHVTHILGLTARFGLNTIMATGGYALAQLVRIPEQWLMKYGRRLS